MCSERALALYIVGISLGGWQNMYMEQLVDSVVGRVRDAMTTSCVARGDSRAYRWRPREVTRARQSMLRSWEELTYWAWAYKWCWCAFLDVTRLKYMWNLCNRCVLEGSMWRKWIIISADVKCILACIPVKVRMCAAAARFGESVGIRGRFGRTDQASWESGWGDPEVRVNPAWTYIYFLTSSGDSVNLGWRPVWEIPIFPGEPRWKWLVPKFGESEVREVWSGKLPARLGTGPGNSHSGWSPVYVYVEWMNVYVLIIVIYPFALRRSGTCLRRVMRNKSV